jgi:HD-like signal output (HDOD) protein
MLGMKRNKRDATAQLKQALGRAEMPTIPGLVTEAIAQVSDPDCDLRRVAKTIGYDPGISARLLASVNSAAFSPRRPIVAIDQATAMLGRNHLESMLIALAAGSAVNTSPPPGFNLPRFWRISSWRASAAASLSRRFDRSRSGINFSASLLEEIAVPLLVAGQPRYAAVISDWYAGVGPLEDLEQAAFGWTHKTVAGWLCSEWGFPDSLRDAVTETGDSQDPNLEYPIVRVVSALSAPLDYPEVIADAAAKISNRFDVPEEPAVAMLEQARLDGLTIAESFK